MNIHAAWRTGRRRRKACMAGLQRAAYRSEAYCAAFRTACFINARQHSVHIERDIVMANLSVCLSNVVWSLYVRWYQHTLGATENLRYRSAVDITYLSLLYVGYHTNFGSSG